MWLGAHPGDPSHLVGADGGRVSLLDAVRADPEALLGADRAAKWSGSLPFLLKVLAADEPLSLQAHPSAAQAAEGFARENAAGHPASTRRPATTATRSHKPELICALTEFHALVGFREPPQTLRAAARPGRRRSWPRTPRCWRRSRTPTGCGRCSPPGSRCRSRCSTACCRRCRRAACGWRRGGEFGREARMALELSERYPGDAGVLAALLLNLVVLQPGEALYLPAGQPARLPVRRRRRADGELGQRAARRADPKHVDVARAAAGARLHRRHAAGAARRRGRGGWIRYDTDAAEFLLRRLDADRRRPPRVPVPDAGPRILLCTGGAAQVRGAGGEPGARARPGAVAGRPPTRASRRPAGAGARSSSSPATALDG